MKPISLGSRIIVFSQKNNTLKLDFFTITAKAKARINQQIEKVRNHTCVPDLRPRRMPVNPGGSYR
jgi:hypothetical protein